MEPVASVVIFSDYGLGGRTDWHEMKDVLAALARQDFREPVEFILVESADRREDIPSDLVLELVGQLVDKSLVVADAVFGEPDFREPRVGR